MRRKVVLPEVPVRWATREQSELDVIQRGLVGCEVGVHTGSHAKWLYDNMAPKKLYLVDTWDEAIGRKHLPNYGPKEVMDGYYKTVLEIFETQIKAGNVKVLRCDSVLGASKLKPTLNWVVIDGDHTRAGSYRDYKAYWPKLKSGGVMICHDYTMFAKERKGCAVPEGLADFMSEVSDAVLVGKSAEKYACNAVVRKK